MESKKLTRRALIEGGSALGLLVLGGGSLGCGGGGIDCSNPPGMSDAERTQRTTLAYVDRSTNPSQRCEVCTFFTARPDACGTCSLNLGPVSPQGYCSSFAARS